MSALGLALLVRLVAASTAGPAAAAVATEHVADAVILREQCLAIAGDDLFFVDGAGLKRVPKAGGRPVTLVEDTPGVIALRAEGKDLFWLDAKADGTGRLMTIPMQGGPVRTLFEGEIAGDSLAVDPDAVWFSTGKDSRHLDRVAGVPRRGAPTVKELARLKGNICSVGVDADYVYASQCDERRIVRIRRGGGVPEVLAGDMPVEPYRLTVVKDAVIFDTRGHGAVWEIPKTGEKTGGKPIALSPLPALNSYYVADEKDLFFIPTPAAGIYTGRDATVVWVHRKPSSTITLEPAMDRPGAIAIDRTHVYWVRNRKEIVRARRDPAPR
jgi:hypothetical protein